MTINPDKPIDACDDTSHTEKNPDENSSKKNNNDNEPPRKIDPGQGEAPKKTPQPDLKPPQTNGKDNAPDDGKTPAAGKKPPPAPADSTKTAEPSTPPAESKSTPAPADSQSAPAPGDGKSAPAPGDGKSAPAPASAKEPVGPSASGKAPDSAKEPAKDDPYNYPTSDPEGWPVPSMADNPADVGLVKVDDLDKPIPGMPRENDLYVNAKSGDVYKKTAFGIWDHIGKVDETGQYKPDVPVTEPQKYPDQDPEGHAVPPPGGNPEYYGLTKTSDIPNEPDAYINEKTGDAYRRNADGTWDHIGMFDSNIKKLFPDTGNAKPNDAPQPVTAKAPAEQYTERDQQGYPVPEPGTRPGDANLLSTVNIVTPIDGLHASQNTFVNMETGDVYVRDSDTNTYDHIGKVTEVNGKLVFRSDDGPADVPKGDSPDLPETSEEGFPVPKKGSTPAENNLKPVTEMVNPPPYLPKDPNLYVASDGKVFQLQDDGSWVRKGKVDITNNTYNPLNRGNTGVPFGFSPALPEKDNNGHGVPKKDSTPEENNVKLVAGLHPPPYNMPSGSDLDGLYAASDGKVYKWHEDGGWTRVGRINLLTNNYDKNDNR